ncbi:hypothetical protein BGAL_0231g00010 [Botrytis galanthina]|uniref:Uncharacterized protein n=1 Tax=Botrytis galanthina TaxID=278940 RepID=A0A4S8QU57_9HELO|nr:hypothetical protein BGAL_0231g00010 [Botrytis galanthina]
MAGDTSTTAEGIAPPEYPHDFDAITPQSTVCSSGTSRVVETALMNQISTQTTPSKATRIELKATVPVKLICWSGGPGNGDPNITVEGPTNGQNKIDARRLGGYRVELR